MSEEQQVELNEETQALLDQVNKLYPAGSIFVQFKGKKSGYVRHDQATQKTIPGALVILVTDLTEPNYTASHELLHLLMLLSGFPQIFFQLSLGDKALDEQMMIMSTDLYNVVMHQVVVDEQRKHGLINERIEDEYLTGIEKTLTVEKEDDDERALRLLTLLDALVFYGDHISKYEDRLSSNYPTAFAAAQKIYREITKKPIKDAFDMWRSIVKIYSLFDEQMKEWGLPALNNNKFTTLSPVLSERQLRLKVRQVFEIFNSGMTSLENGKPAYVGLRRNDGQNSFTLPNYTPAEFRDIYDQPVKEFLEQHHIPYIVRK